MIKSVGNLYTEIPLTISTTQSALILEGNGVTQTFTINFTPDTAQNIAVIYTASGVATTLSPSQYSISIPSPATGQLWPTLFFLTYPLSGSPIASGTTLTVQRILPLQQNTALGDQGNFYPEVVEEAMDTLEMQIQQISARTGQMRGTWASGIVYNFGDVVQDGVNGSSSLNYYMCAIANTSSVWSTDLAAGDWSLVITSIQPTVPLPVTIANGGTGAITAVTALNNLGGVSLSGTNAFTGANSFTGGSISVPTVGAGDSTTKAASTAFVNGTALTLATGTTAVTQANSDNSTKVATTAYVANAVGGVGGSGLILLNTVNASGAVSVSFGAAYITSAYARYVIKYDGLIPSASGQDLYLTVSTNNGSNYLNSAYNWVCSMLALTATTFAGRATNNDAQINITAADTLNNTTSCGSIEFTNPSAVGPCYFTYENIINQANSTHRGIGYNTGTTVINAVKLAMSGGATMTGNFHLYGILGT